MKRIPAYSLFARNRAAGLFPWFFCSLRASVPELFSPSGRSFRGLISFVCALGIVGTLGAQNFAVCENGAQRTTYSVLLNQTIVFSNGRMLVSTPELLQGNHAIYEVQTILFKEMASSQTQTSINESQQSNLTVSLFPNPVLTDLTIRFAEIPANKVDFSIYSIDGKQHLVDNAAVISSKEYLLHVSKLASGMYMLRIVNGQNIQNIRFVKNNFNK